MMIGEKLMTLKEIAEHLNISATTVSNVIHGKTKEVSPTTVKRVQDYLEEVHYAPNIMARNLAQNRSKIIGLVLKRSLYQNVNIFTDPFIAELIGGIEKSVREAGYFMMLYISDDMDEIIRYVSGWNVDGLILFTFSDEDTLRFHQQYTKPAVYIDTYIDEKTELSMDHRIVNVGLDDEAAIYDATRYLIECGHRRIGFLSLNYTGVDIERYAGFQRALKEAGIPITDQNLMQKFYSSDGSLRTYREIAKDAANFTAVVASSDSTAILLSNALEEAGYRVPEDISIIGFDDSTQCIFSRKPLTTIRQNIPMKGEVAVRTLIQMIHGHFPKEKNIILPTELIKRETVRIIPEEN